MQVNLNDFPIMLRQLCHIITKKQPHFLTKYMYTLDEKMIFQTLEQVLSDEEKRAVQFVLEHQRPIMVIGNHHLPHFEQLQHTAVIKPLLSDRYYVDHDFLNLYNQYVFNNAYAKLSPLSKEDQQSIAWLSRRETNIRLHQNISLIQALDLYFSLDQLKAICRHFKIKGYSNKKKKDIAKLLKHAFTENPARFIHTFAPEEQFILAQFVLLNQNCLPVKTPGELSMNAFVIQIDPLETVVFLPPELMPVVKSYFDSQHLNPLDFVPKSRRHEFENV